MISVMKILSIALFLVALAGCRTAPIYNVKEAHLGSEGKTIEDVGRAIRRAGRRRGWAMYQIEEGKIRGALTIRGHQAEVIITYNTQTFSIEYAKSLNLKYDEEKREIHKNYNSWVQRLERTIQAEVFRTVPSQNASASRNATFSGSAFFINPKGHLLTNNHVVRDCGQIYALYRGKKITAEVVAKDAQNDLAILKIENQNNASATFRTGRRVEQGEDVLAAGFPHAGILGDSPKITDGIISDPKGPQNFAGLLQHTAEVQAGNSGGPLLDLSGNVVGVVVAKLDALRFFLKTGDLPQNVNFAINTRIAQILLDNYNVDYQVGPSEKKEEKTEISRRARGYTIRVECKAK